MRVVAIVAVFLSLSLGGCGNDTQNPRVAPQAFNSEPDADLLWTMIEVPSGDAHLIQVRGGQTVLIDTSADLHMRQRVLPFLEAEGIARLDMVIVTHSHRDHVGGLVALLGSGVRCERVIGHRIADSVCETEGPVYCAVAELDAIDAELARRGLFWENPVPGDRIDLGAGASFLVLSGSDGLETPIGTTNINESSLVLRLEFDGHRMLFTGDLGMAMGDWLSLQGRELRSQVLKVPHHGLEPVPDDRFFEQVGAPHVLISSGPGVWCHERAMALRDLYRRLEIPVLISSVVGNVRVRIDGGELTVHCDRDSVAFCP